MLIKLSPQRRDDTLELERFGEVLIINGVAFDLSGIENDGEQEFPDSMFAEPVKRIGNEITATIILPLPSDNPSHGAKYPEDIIDPEDGIIPLPVSY